MKPYTLPGTLDRDIHKATQGDKRAARKLAKGIAELLEAGDPLPDAARRYLVEGLRVIADGGAGNDAFHTAGKRGVKDQDIEFARRAWSDWQAHWMQSYLDHGEAATPHEASLLAEQFFRYETDASTIRKAHRKLYPRR